MGADLWLRYLIIALAAHIACAWIQTFQTPWPLVDAFELADTAEEQLLRSLGIRFDELVLFATIVSLINRTRVTLATDSETYAINITNETEGLILCCISSNQYEIYNDFLSSG